MIVFPTPVGVFPFRPWTYQEWMSLPHARGGVSTGKRVCGHDDESSPRPWGCFPRGAVCWHGSGVFPTPVGVFLTADPFSATLSGLPHARGGVSPIVHPSIWIDWSSPRPWGCFSWQSWRQGQLHVFPTPVGVFLLGSGRRHQCWSLPHARGGVSRALQEPNGIAESSPRPWGCF